MLFVCASALAVVQWPVINHTIVIYWWITTVSLVAFRFLLFSQFQRAVLSGINNEIWANRFFVGVLGSGLSWAGAAFLLFPDQDGARQIFLVVIIAMLAVGSVSALASDMRASIIFQVLVILPLGIRLALNERGSYRLLAGMVVFFLVGSILNARRINGLIKDMYQLRKAYLEQVKVSRSSEKMFKMAFKSSPSPMAISTPNERRFLHINQSFSSTFGFDEREVVGKTSAELGINEIFPQEPFVARATVEDQSTRGSAISVRTKTGEVRSVLFSDSLIQYGEQELKFTVINDVTDRLRALTSEQKYQELVEEVPVGIYKSTPDGKLIEANHALAHLMGFESVEALKKINVADGYVKAEDRRAWQRQIEKEGVTDGVVQWFKRNGQSLWVREIARAIRDEQGRIVFYKGVIEDITARRRAEKEVSQTLARLAGLRSISEAILEAQSEKEIAQVAVEHARALIPCAHAELIEIDSDSGVQTILGSYSDKLHRPLGPRKLKVNYLSNFLNHVKVRLVDDLITKQDYSDFDRELQSVGIRSSLTAPLNARGKLIGALVLGSEKQSGFLEEHLTIAREIAGSLALALHDSRQYAEILKLAVTDPLTGLHNRRNLFELGQAAIERDRRFDRPFSAIMLDVDHFKQFNDTFGHSAGDKILQSIATQCRRTVRTIDIIGRYGGEEFVILMPETDLPGAAMLAERLRESVEDMPVSVSNGAHAINITASLGVAEIGDSVIDLHALLGLADKAMYRAKRMGRNRCVIYEKKSSDN